MTEDEKYRSEVVNKVWREYLTKGEVSGMKEPWFRSKWLRSVYRLLPDNPRCRMCYYPFKGIGGSLMRHMFGVVPSRLNPQLCNQCEQFAQAHKGGAEVELSILFADVRGSTSLAEKMSPTEFSQLINRFYNTTTTILFGANAMVEKLIGDAVTGFFTPGFSGPDHARVAVDAAREILRATGHQNSAGPWISVGIGVHTGMAYVGTINSDSGVTDIAVLGDTANTGARLAAQAETGRIVVSKATAQAAGLDPAGVEIRQQLLKGRSEPIEMWVL